MEIQELYADAAGATHFRITTVAFELRDFSPPSPAIGVTADLKPSAAVFLSAPPGWDKVFHPTPRKQLAVILSGELTVTATDGALKRFGPGGCFVLNDAGSKGHLTEVQGGANVHALMVAIACLRGYPGFRPPLSPSYISHNIHYAIYGRQNRPQTYPQPLWNHGISVPCSAEPIMTDTPQMQRLLAIMARLRDPNGGCPWDLEQSFRTIAPYTIEEAYEVAEAAENDDVPALKEELGDLLLQVVFHSQMAEEAGKFAFEDVAKGISDKMIARHPHVFAAADIANAEATIAAWEDLKAKERAAKGAASALDGVGPGMPALTRAAKLQRRAARVGFDWPDVEPILDKLEEEIAEVCDAMSGEGRDRVEDELGDLLFTVVNLARKLDHDPEQALRRACRKFERRFRRVETLLGDDGKQPGSASLDEMEAKWQWAKREENKGEKP
ncbi:MAG TPA: nucleoside triphosphate pyrophosphohydrolase [Stellaceae bacterium]|nr:nucleoside triphosphate pyrophosphohydrolase [Stellaceae bacterium]